MGGSSGELQDLTNTLVDGARAYRTKVCKEKRKVTKNNTSNTSADSNMNGRKLEQVTSFKYLEANLCKDGVYSAEVSIRIASTTRFIHLIL